MALLMIMIGDGGAQELNKRMDGPPASKATIGRLMPKSRVQAADQGADLGKDIVNTDCQPLQIGNVDSEDRTLRPSDNAVVIRGNVVNLCQ